MSGIIFHLAERSLWRAAVRLGAYRPPSLETEGFIHCSEAGQVQATANRLFHGRRDLLLLTVAEDRLAAEVRRENLEGGDELFPHVYGAIETAAVRDVAELRPTAEGDFVIRAQPTEAAP